MPLIKVPRVGVVKFPDDMSQEQILRAIETDIIPNYQRPEYGVIESGIKGLKRGASRMGSMVTDTIPALIGSGLGFDEYAKRQLEEGAQKEAELQRTNPAQFTSYKQVEGLGDALRFGAETLGESATDILGIIGTGGVGGALGKRAAVKGAEQLAENIAKREAIRDVLPGGVSAARAAELEAAAVREAASAMKAERASRVAASPSRARAPAKDAQLEASPPPGAAAGAASAARARAAVTAPSSRCGWPSNQDCSSVDARGNGSSSRPA